MSVKNRGFGSMSPERRSEVGKKGAETAKQKGHQHRWSSSAAKAASQKGLAARRKHKEDKKSGGHLVPSTRTEMKVLIRSCFLHGDHAEDVCPQCGH